MIIITLAILAAMIVMLMILIIIMNNASSSSSVTNCNEICNMLALNTRYEPKVNDGLFKKSILNFIFLL